MLRINTAPPLFFHYRCVCISCIIIGNANNSGSPSAFFVCFCSCAFFFLLALLTIVSFIKLLNQQMRLCTYSFCSQFCVQHYFKTWCSPGLTRPISSLMTKKTKAKKGGEKVIDFCHLFFYLPIVKHFATQMRGFFFGIVIHHLPKKKPNLQHVYTNFKHPVFFSHFLSLLNLSGEFQTAAASSAKVDSCQKSETKQQPCNC